MYHIRAVNGDSEGTNGTEVSNPPSDHSKDLPKTPGNEYADPENVYEVCT